MSAPDLIYMMMWPHCQVLEQSHQNGLCHVNMYIFGIYSPRPGILRTQALVILPSSPLYRMSHSYRSGHRRFRHSSKKNSERKKYNIIKKPSYSPCLHFSHWHCFSVLKVSIPIHLLSFNVSLPLKAFLESHADCLGTLKSRLAVLKAIPLGLELIF